MTDHINAGGKFAIISLVMACLCFLTACQTSLAPTGANDPASIKYHANLQTAGIYGALYWQNEFQGYLVDDEYVADYGILVKTAKMPPLNPFSTFTHPFSEYAIKYNVGAGAIIVEPLQSFLASSSWPSSFIATNIASSAAASQYEQMLRLSRAP